MNRWLERESEDWVRDGVIDAEQRSSILARYATKSTWQQQVLSLLAGSAIGASIVALWALLVFELGQDDLQDGWAATGFFLAFAIPLIGLGTLLPRLEIARPAMLGGLIPLLASSVIPDTDWFPWVALITVAGLFALLWKQNLRPLLLLATGLILIGISAASTLDEEPGISVWLLLSAASFAGVWLAPAREWAAMGKLLTSVAVIVSWLAFVVAVISPDFDGGYSLTFSAGMVAMVGLAIWQKENSPTLAFGLALTAGLVVFAFESGGIIAGVIALVTLSAGFLFLSFRNKS